MINGIRIINHAEVTILALKTNMLLIKLFVFRGVLFVQMFVFFASTYVEIEKNESFFEWSRYESKKDRKQNQ